MTIRQTLIAVLFGLACAPVLAEDFPQAQMRNTEARRLPSNIMDYEYGVYVTLPRGYAENPDRIYPTLYIIDGHPYYVFTGEPARTISFGFEGRECTATRQLGASWSDCGRGRMHCDDGRAWRV